MEKRYVEERDHGYWIAGTRVSLDSVVLAFLEGFSPETCQRLANRLGFDLALPSAEETASADPGQLDLFAGKSDSES